jgi:hypothetical protein
MPKLSSKESERKYDEYNELRRNLKRMTPEECERYVKGESLFKILGKRYKRGMK